METRRPTVPEAEEILGGYFPVLDHGFVALVDYMGTDDSVERAARVSYGYGTRKRSRTRGLIRYLRRHRHTTPSEMVEFKFHCCMPIFVARQWVRHRTACLAEGTEVYFDLPGGIERRGNQLYKLPIEEIWTRFQPTRNRTRPDKQGNPYYKRDRVRKMYLRQMNEDSGRIQHTRIVDVFRNGPKPVFRMTLADGKQIEATADHRFLFEDGWSTLREATGLREQGGRAVWRPGDYYLYVNGTRELRPELYRDPDWLHEVYHERRLSAREVAELCGASEPTIRKWLRKHGISAHPSRRGFQKGHAPWNKGKTYRLGPRKLSDEWIEANHRARAGAASNFWKGGVSDGREAIARWTTQVAPQIHRRNQWTCQLCHNVSNELHAHHVVPVWADESLARKKSNLTTLCGDCHRKIRGRELEFVEELGGPAVKAEWEPKPRIPWNSLRRAKLVRVESFEFVGTKETYDLEVEGPHHNFVANGIVTHNSLNEYSARYSLLPLLYYTPDREDFALQSRTNRQGREGEAAAEELYRRAVERWEDLRSRASDVYTELLEEDLARELARIDLPLSIYTQWYWKIDLHNLFHFLTLRVDDHAQHEIREYAKTMAGMVKRVAPLSYEAWVDYELGGRHLSRAEREALARLVEATENEVRPRADAGALDEEALREVGMSGREIREFRAKLAAPEAPDFELDLSRMRPAEEVKEEMSRAVPEALE